MDDPTNLDDAQVISFLNQLDNANDAARVREFAVYLAHGLFTVKVKDFGPEAGSHRYSVEAYRAGMAEQDKGTDHPLYTLGHQEPTLFDALDGPHWSDLTRNSN